MDLVERREPPAARHPWEVARLRFFVAVLRRAGLLRPETSLLDVGAGDAWLAGELVRRGGLATAVCWDQGYTPAAVARLGLDEGGPLRLVAERPAGRFELALLLDVLEHVPEDRAFLADLAAESLAPGGHALVSVPAWPALYSRHDRALQHHRRYTPAGARALLEEAGLELLASGGLFHSLLLPRALAAGRERLAPRAAADPAGVGAWRAPAAVTAAVTAALRADTSLTLLLSRAGLSLPGLSFWALCRKPSR